MKDEKYVSNISANQMFQRTVKVFKVDSLLNELHEGNVVLVKVN